MGADRPRISSRERAAPVRVYKIGDSYFVEDGNHRVSVARYHGVEWIDAEVTEFHIRLPKRRRGVDVPTSYPKGGDKDTTNAGFPDLAAASREDDAGGGAKSPDQGAEGTVQAARSEPPP